MTTPDTGKGGFSLQGRLFVICGAVLVLILGITGYRMAVEMRSVRQAAQILTDIKTRTQKAFAEQRSYGTADKDIIRNLSPGHIHHPWGNKVTVSAQDQTFEIGFSRVPRKACIRLGTVFDRNDSDFVALKVNGAEVTEIKARILEDTRFCGAGDKADMVWTFF